MAAFPAPVKLNVKSADVCSEMIIKEKGHLSTRGFFACKTKPCRETTLLKLSSKNNTLHIRSPSFLKRRGVLCVKKAVMYFSGGFLLHKTKP